MSIPTNQLVYAGFWDVAKTYPQYYFVISPIDNLCYINTDITPVTGGADPSVQPSAIWTLFPNVTGDITGITSGVGISGGGTTGNVTITNTGVTSLDGNTGALTTKCATWYKTAAQTISTTGSPNFVQITAPNSTAWSDTATITPVPASVSSWTVNQNGIYMLDGQITIGSLAGATFTDPTVRLSFNAQRGAVNNTLIATSVDWANATPTNPSLQVSGLVQLNAGDVLTFVISSYLSANSFTLSAPFASPSDYDLNTFWSWTLIKPLP